MSPHTRLPPSVPFVPHAPPPPTYLCDGLFVGVSPVGAVCVKPSSVGSLGTSCGISFPVIPLFWGIALSRLP